MTSISQKPPPQAWPDWRNFGVLLRVLVGVNALAALASLLQPGGVLAWIGGFVTMAAWIEPVALICLGALAAGRDRLAALPLRQARAVVVAGVAVVAWLYFHLWQWAGLSEAEPGDGMRALILGAAVAAGMLAYFDLRARAYSPALAEARLMALNARIRPHFLFNSINAVLSLIRAEPRRAEAALETVSDLFRAALRDPGDWLPLSEEIALCRQYLELEKLRLGDRLRVDWEIRDVPLDLPIPPLMLQPLVENAVYHGIEPAAEGGVVDIAFSRRGDAVLIEVANPRPAASRLSSGHHLALANIRERLTLYFDLEARLSIEETPTRYAVRILLPCRPHPHPSAS